MGQIILSESFASAIDTDVWNKDTGSQASSDYDSILATGGELVFTRSSVSGMRSAFLTLKKQMASADYSVTVKAKISSGDGGAILIGLRCTGPDANDTDRAGYYAGLSIDETGGKEGGGGHSWFDDHVHLNKLGGSFNWDATARLALTPGVGILHTGNLAGHVAVASGTFAELTFSVNGDVLEFWSDGVLICRTVNTAITGAGFVRIGVQSDDATSMSAIFDDFEVFLLEGAGQSGNAASYAHVGFDEARNDVIISVPTAGADTPQQFVYDITHDEWYKRDQVIRSFGFALDTLGERQLLFGDSSGFVNVFNATANWTDDSTTFTGTWQSNWLDMGDKQKRKLFERLIVDLAKASSGTRFAVTLEVADHPDGYTQKVVGTVHTSNLRTSLMARLGGRYVRVKVVHSADGTLEIERILTEMPAATADRVEAR